MVTHISKRWKYLSLSRVAKIWKILINDSALLSSVAHLVPECLATAQWCDSRLLLAQVDQWSVVSPVEEHMVNLWAIVDAHKREDSDYKVRQLYPYMVLSLILPLSLPEGSCLCSSPCAYHCCEESPGTLRGPIWLYSAPYHTPRVARLVLTFSPIVYD